MTTTTGPDVWGQDALAWGSSAEGRAQITEAYGFATRIGVRVTQAEIASILLAAWTATVPADESGKTRVKRRLEFSPEGADDGELPRSFRLASMDEPQRRDERRAGGWVGTGPAVRTVLAEGITRRELQALIGDAADWLAWDGTDGG